MTHYAQLLEKLSGLSVATVEGCGADGGISALLLAFGNTTIRSGIDTILEPVIFSELLVGASAVITGEGKIDAQSYFGRAISGVANRAVA